MRRFSNRPTPPGVSASSAPSARTDVSGHRSPTSPARHFSPSPPPGRRAGRGGPAGAYGGGWGTFFRVVQSAASIAAHALIGIALARLAVAIDSRPALVREALQVGLRTLAVDDRGRQPTVLPVASEKLKPPEGQALTPPLPQPSPPVPAEREQVTNPLVLWEYRLPSWGEVVYTPAGTPVTTGTTRLQETVAAAIQEFQERNPRVEVKVVWLAEGEILPELARAAAGAGELPDVVALPGALIAHPRAVPLTRFVPENPNYLPVVRQAERLAAGSAGSFTGEDGPWVIPRWLEWQTWVGSQVLWQKLGLDSARIIRSGWQWSDVTEIVQKFLGAKSSGGGNARAGVYLFPTAWMFTGLLLASDHPTPYVWPAENTSSWNSYLRSAPADGKRVELCWDDKFLYRLVKTWQEWTRQAGPQPYGNDALAGWLITAQAGALLIGGPIGPTLAKYLAAGPAGQPGSGGQQGTPPDAKLLFFPIPAPVAGAGAVLPVRLSAYQVFATSKVHPGSGAQTGSQSDADRIRLAAELGLILARRVGAWAGCEFGLLPVDTASPGPRLAAPSCAPAGLAVLLQAAPRLVAQPLLPPAFAQTMEQALEELARSAPELAAGRTDPTAVTRRLLDILQAPLDSVLSADRTGADTTP